MIMRNRGCMMGMQAAMMMVEPSTQVQMSISDVAPVVPSLSEERMESRDENMGLILTAVIRPCEPGQLGALVRRDNRRYNPKA